MSEIIVGFPPFYCEDSKVLILGSFPSVKSRQQSFYYGNAQNAFWRILAKFFGEEAPATVQQKKQFLSAHKIALWDIVTECEIIGSRDETIKNYKVANVPEVLQNAPIECILINGGRAYGIFIKQYKELSLPYIKLPSTSPANTRRNDNEWYSALSAAFGRTQ